MNRSRMIARGLVSFALAQALLVLGIALLMQKIGADYGIEVALAMVAAGTLLAMLGMIDRLVTDAGRCFTGTLKLLVAAVFFIASSLMFLSVLTGRYELITPA